MNDIIWAGLCISIVLYFKLKFKTTVTIHRVTKIGNEIIEDVTETKEI